MSHLISHAPARARSTLRLNAIAIAAMSALPLSLWSLSASAGGTCSPFSTQNDDTRVTEGTSRRAIFVVRNDNCSAAATIDFAATAGSADTSDFTPVSGTLSFVVGETSQRFFIDIADDSLDEPNETIDILLSNAQSAQTTNIVDADAVLTIRDNDGPPSVSISGAASVQEGDDAMFSLTLDQVSGQDVIVRLSLGGTAVRAEDYGFRGQRVLIPAGILGVIRDLRSDATDVYSDGIADDGETIILTITQASGASIDPMANELTITTLDP